MTISGEARKLIVEGLPSLRPLKLRLYEEKMALVSPLLTPSVRFHCPIQGPHALAKTVLPDPANVSSVESRDRVARICSLPGVTKKSALRSSPAVEACFTRSSALVMSS